MSWSVQASGKPDDVGAELEKQFVHPLADPPAGIDDDGERETVRKVKDTIMQCVSTFDPEVKVAVRAYGHISFSDYTAKTGSRQTVHVEIDPA
jgi:hypothetical protein